MNDANHTVNTDLPAVVVVPEPGDAESQAAAVRLAAELRLALVASPAAPRTGLLLYVTRRGLELREASSRGIRGVRVDLHTLALRPGRGHLSRRQPLTRAVGRGAETVFDATAGLANDAALLALMGYDVTAVERSPVLAALVRDGIERARVDERLTDETRQQLREHLRIVTADSRTVLRALETAPDVVYIDPMFPPKRKPSALARKSIRLVRRLVGEDSDAAELLEAARAAARRVVVKRPTHAKPIGDPPTASIEGKLVRYDVYVAAGQSR